MKYLTFLLICFCLQLNAQMPAYYNSVDFTATPEEVKSQLAYLVRNTQLYHLNYTPQTWYALKETDAVPGDSNNVFLIYGYNDNDGQPLTDRTRGKDMTCHSISCTNRWNREHVYPKSIGNFSVDSWPGTDVHALRACDSNFNDLRSNLPFAAGNGNARVLANSRFYPGDEWKGDVARMIMFMYLRYPNDLLPNYVGLGSHTYHTDMPDIFLEWNAEDPPSEVEIARNDIIESDYQGNRNPFIDNPYLATYIWGGPEAQNNWETMGIQEVEVQQFSITPNPTYDFISYQRSYDQILIYNIQGKLVKEDLDLSDKKTYLPQQAGLYFVKFCKQNKCRTEKVIKK